mmetsp:Transcript_68540/g.212804  ORF Transcript_68540/g.212804 Transcript_68540/m.212804 type:complete len:102 (-) Transcript_68540:135-440(-)
MPLRALGDNKMHVHAKQTANPAEFTMWFQEVVSAYYAYCVGLPLEFIARVNSFTAHLRTHCAYSTRSLAEPQELPQARHAQHLRQPTSQRYGQQPRQQQQQ